MGFRAFYDRHRYWSGVSAVGVSGGFIGALTFFRIYGVGEDIAEFWVPFVVGGAVLAGAVVFVAVFLFFQWVFIDALKSLLGFHR